MSSLHVVLKAMASFVRRAIALGMRTPQDKILRRTPEPDRRIHLVNAKCAHKTGSSPAKFAMRAFKKKVTVLKSQLVQICLPLVAKTAPQKPKNGIQKLQFLVLDQISEIDQLKARVEQLEDEVWDLQFVKDNAHEQLAHALKRALDSEQILFAYHERHRSVRLSLAGLYKNKVQRKIPQRSL